MTDSPQKNGRPVCGAKKRHGGGTCTKPAGWGTNHFGEGQCKLHLGNTPSHLGHIATREAKKQMVAMGQPVDITPGEALIHCVQIAAGEVAYASQMIAELKPDEVIGNPVTTTERTGMEKGEHTSWEEVREAPPELHIWVRVRRDALDKLARFSKMALDAGVEERRVRLAERYAQELAPALRRLIEGLNLTEKQRQLAPALMRETLAQLERPGMPLAEAEAEAEVVSA